MSFVPSAAVYEAPDYSGPISARFGAANVVSMDDDMSAYELPEGYQIPMMYTDDQIAELDGARPTYTGGTLSDNIRSLGGFRRRRTYRKRRPTRKYTTRRRVYRKKPTKKRKPIRKNTRRVRRRTVTCRPVRRRSCSCH